MTHTYLTLTELVSIALELHSVLAGIMDPGKRGEISNAVVCEKHHLDAEQISFVYAVDITMGWREQGFEHMAIWKSKDGRYHCLSDKACPATQDKIRFGILTEANQIVH